MVSFDPFGRLAEVERWKMEQDRLRGRDNMLRQEFEQGQKDRQYKNALAQLAQEREEATQNALRFGVENQPYLETLRSDPAMYNEAQAINRQDMLRFNPRADVSAVMKYGDRMESAPAAKQGRVQTIALKDGIYTVNPDGTKGQKLGDAPAGKGLVNINTGSRPMPPAALKMQQEELDAIALASSIKADLGGIRKLISGGGLDLGPVSNVAGKALNYAGMSTENSRNLASFQSTLEKMRNDSLRLNKGVQTEGDAVRAWNELLSNINDKQLVMKRLGEIERINNRAANYRKQNVQNIRDNYGNQMIDVSPYENQQSVFDEADGDLSSLSDDELLQALGR